MKCGNCKQDHGSVREVRKCYGLPETRPTAPGQQTLPGTGRAKPAGRIISSVPGGYYALDSATGNNDLDFYRVDVVEKGKWAGHVFVKRVIGGRPEVNIRKVEAAQVLLRIQGAGVQAAQQRYGQEIGRCGRCNRHLTDETSRAYGLGPECRKAA